ncbi:WYL domain-containing protein [Streptomyces thermolilacinus]|uniref:WYL domain-containing protein n=1 Tax=Streptomyces thermolilacinus TaxID=285540 RepID=UPI0033C5EE6C
MCSWMCGLTPWWMSVFKAGVWYLVADHAGRPRLFRADRLRGVTVTTEPVRRRDDVELGAVWEELRREVEAPGAGGASSGRACGGTGSTCCGGSPAPTSCAYTGRNRIRRHGCPLGRARRGR